MRISIQYSMSNISCNFKNITKSLLLFVSFFVFQTSEAQYKIPDVPKFQTSVYDYVNLLSAAEKSNLEQKLIRYSDTTSTQIVVAIIPSTEGENINFLGAQWGEKWGIGQDKDNGILVLLARNDRRIAINNGYGVESLLTDALSRRIIERDIIPYFKQNDYYGGLNRGSDAIFEVLTGAYQGSRQSSGGGFPVELFFILFVFFIIFIIALSKQKGGRGGGNGNNRSDTTSILEAIILSNMGRGSYKRRSSGGFGSFGGGFGGGSSGGGFGGGFGGGSFGGGGASGGW